MFDAIQFAPNGASEWRPATYAAQSPASANRQLIERSWRPHRSEERAYHEALVAAPAVERAGR
jgi:hypothetical protein